MKFIASFVASTILLLSQEANSFSSSTSSGLFQRTNPSTTTTSNNRQHTQQQQRRRNEFPFATSITTKTTTSLSVATPVAVGAITGVLTGGILGGALHAIAGKFILFFCFVSRHKIQNSVQTDGPPRTRIRTKSGFFWCFDDKNYEKLYKSFFSPHPSSSFPVNIHQ
jgi:predicted PurR-regulated permease PerM